MGAGDTNIEFDLVDVTTEFGGVSNNRPSNSDRRLYLYPQQHLQPSCPQLRKKSPK